MIARTTRIPGDQEALRRLAISCDPVQGEISTLRLHPDPGLLYMSIAGRQVASEASWSRCARGVGPEAPFSTGPCGCGRLCRVSYGSTGPFYFSQWLIKTFRSSMSTVPSPQGIGPMSQTVSCDAIRAPGKRLARIGAPTYNSPEQDLMHRNSKDDAEWVGRTTRTYDTTLTTRARSSPRHCRLGSSRAFWP